MIWLLLHTLGFSLVNKLDRRHTGRQRKRDNLLSGEGRNGRSLIIRRRESLVVYKSYSLGGTGIIQYPLCFINLYFSRLAATFLLKKLGRLLNFNPWYFSSSEHAQRDPVHDEQQLLLALPRPLPERRHAQVCPYHGERNKDRAVS
jgi:hypothetical protein